MVVFGTSMPTICIVKKILEGNKEVKSIPGSNMEKDVCCTVIESFLEDIMKREAFTYSNRDNGYGIWNIWVVVYYENYCFLQLSIMFS